MENNHKAEIMYESEGKTSNGKPFITVKKARGYFEYTERGGQDSIAFILFDKDEEEFGLILESKPPLDERFHKEMMLTTAFGGSIDSDHSNIDICQIEVLEEAGYKVELNKIHSIGQSLVSSQMSQMITGYLVDVTGLKPTKTEADIKNEDQDKKDPNEFCYNKVVWFNTKDLMEKGDWKSIWIFTRAIYLDILTKNDL